MTSYQSGMDGENGVTDETVPLADPSMEWVATALRELIGRTVMLVQPEYGIRLYGEVRGVGVGVGFAFADEDEEVQLRVSTDECDDLVVHLAPDDWTRARYVYPTDELKPYEVVELEWPGLAATHRPGFAPRRGRNSPLANL